MGASTGVPGSVKRLAVAGKGGAWKEERPQMEVGMDFQGPGASGRLDFILLAMGIEGPDNGEVV